MACFVVAGGILAPVAFSDDWHDDEVSPAELARQAAQMFDLAGVAATTVACDTGPPSVSVDPSLFGPHDTRSAAATRVHAGGQTPEKALAAAVGGLSAEFPRLPYAQQRLSGDRVLFTYAVGGKVKIAITVGPNPSEKGYVWLQSAECDPAELPPSADAFHHVEVWSDAAGKRVSTNVVFGQPTFPGRPDCAGVSFLFLGRGDRYVRDPHKTFTGEMHGRYDAADALPDDAVDTGFRRAGAVLWRADDRTAVYLVRADRTERLPREKGERVHCTP